MWVCVHQQHLAIIMVGAFGGQILFVLLFLICVTTTRNTAMLEGLPHMWILQYLGIVDWAWPASNNIDQFWRRIENNLNVDWMAAFAVYIFMFISTTPCWGMDQHMSAMYDTQDIWETTNLEKSLFF